MTIKIDFGNSYAKLLIGGTMTRLDYDTPCRQLLSEVKDVYISSVKDDAFVLAQMNKWYGDSEATLYRALVSDVAVLKCNYDKSKLGIDRWLAALGAVLKYGDAIVVDAGTAMTVDIVKDGEFRGGVICPGFSLSQDALIAKADKINEKSAEATLLPGLKTSEALANGALIGMVGVIKHFTQCYPGVTVVLSGGDADLLSQHIDGDHIVDQRLIERGFDLAKFEELR